MIATLSLIGIASGTAAAFFAGRFPAYAEALQTGAGVLLIGGLALLGSALPAVL
jgi:hypothetical protein